MSRTIGSPSCILLHHPSLLFSSADNFATPPPPPLSHPSSLLSSLPTFLFFSPSQPSYQSLLHQPLLSSFCDFLVLLFQIGGLSQHLWQPSLKSLPSLTGSTWLGRLTAGWQPGVELLTFTASRSPPQHPIKLPRIRWAIKSNKQVLFYKVFSKSIFVKITIQQVTMWECGCQEARIMYLCNGWMSNEKQLLDH